VINCELRASSIFELCITTVGHTSPIFASEDAGAFADELKDLGLPRKRLRRGAGSRPASETTPSINMEDGDMNGRSHAQYLQHLLQNGAGSDTISRATSPGLGFGSNGTDLEKEKRYRPRTFPYFKLLPYNVEEEGERNAALEEILKQLYIAIKAEDISPGAVHWTRELKGWLNLKFEITRTLRVKLAKMYYMLALAPGIDYAASERFESMFRYLIKQVTLCYCLLTKLTSSLQEEALPETWTGPCAGLETIMEGTQEYCPPLRDSGESRRSKTKPQTHLKPLLLRIFIL
jgi:hypothetical protein